MTLSVDFKVTSLYSSIILLQAELIGSTHWIIPFVILLSPSLRHSACQ